MPLYDATVPQLRKMLVNLTRWLDEAAAYAESRSFDPEILLGLRLYPDQFPLLRQIQSACDTAKYAASRISGKDAPRHPDDEATVDEIRARIAATIAYLDGYTAADFDGADERVVTLPIMPGKGIAAGDYLNEFALPNFYFHVNAAYSILRTNGVLLGKRKYLGGLSLFDV